nr:immunoglobulin light chain junction region [Macaca mulatta]MOW07558.1 immunoglobulin light chain junction region [Macaca mulatta]
DYYCETWDASLSVVLF